MSRLYPHYQADVLSNCESYMSKLAKKKSENKKPISARDRPICRTTNPIPLQRLPVAKSSVVPFKSDSSERPESSIDNELLHKEVINNKMAQVEVTVRTVSGRSRSRSNSVCEKREPWGKLLQYRKSNDTLASTNFDYALGTIHFLSKELQQKLQTVCPGDPSLHQIVNDIQHTLHRLGPDVIGTKLSQENLTIKDYTAESDTNNTNKKEKVRIIKPHMVNASTQTVIIGDSVSSAQQQIEDKAYKLEKTCKQLETSCTNLKVEKSDIERQLQLERENVRKIKQELEDQLCEQNNKSLHMIKQLREERDTLENQLKQAKTQQEVKENNNLQELQNTIKRLRDDNSTTEYENMNIKHEITVMKLEKEKMTFLLESREKQLKALRNEIEGIQSLVCTQLIDLKSDDYSQTTSRSSIDSKIWKPSQNKKGDRKEKPIHELFLNKMKSQYQNFIMPENVSSTIVNEGLSKKETCTTIKSDFQDEYPQRDIPSPKDNKPIESKLIPSDYTLTSDAPDYAKEDIESNIKEMFAELKRQALVVTLSSPPPQGTS